MMKNDLTVTTTTPTDRYAGFYYTPAGINAGQSTPLEHLAIGLAANVVANGTRKQLAADTVVLNYAQANGRWYAQVGIATGNAVADAATVFWPAWSNPTSVVFEVVWLTKIVEVPAEYFAKQRQYLPLTEVETVSNYVLRHSR
jgi:hypothetical protein